VAKYKDLAK
jgi:sideroflexin-5